MSRQLHLPRASRPLALALAASAALLSACGGGGDTVEALTTENAQGYAADGATMPVNATSAVDSGISVLETALGSTALGGGAQQPQSAQALAATITKSVVCPNGGTVAWTATGPDLATLQNGQFDTGEVYNLTYTRCGTGDSGAMLDGAVTLTVNSRTATSISLTHSTANLSLTTLAGQWTQNGTTSVARSAVNTAVGGIEVTSNISSPGIALTSTIGLRQASYNLNSLNWTVVRTYDSNGNLAARSHDGQVSMDASTPRRPNATLQITTKGMLTLGSDGFAASGSFTVVTARNTIACTYGNGTTTITLDVGSDGTVDRSWSLTRPLFIGEAG